MSQGKTANREGDDFATAISAILAEVGGVHEREIRARRGEGILAEMREYIDSPLFPGNGVFAREVDMGRTIYGREYKLPWLVWRKGWRRPLALIGSTQTGGGSADHKLPYLFENALRCLPVDVLLVLAGPAYLDDPGIMAYVTEKVVESRESKRVDSGKRAVVRFFRGLDEFRRWVSDGMPTDPPPQAQFA